ncbi:MAG: FeS-binding protein [Syntrophus sp. (in: bacteria)]|nr:FeS-binding protein [Syntrophus sp. (in: bacteria)]
MKSTSTKGNLLEKVAIKTCSNYHVKTIKDILSAGLQDIGFPIGKAKVLIKPNLLLSKTPEKAVTTHPAIIGALAELLKDHSCTVYIGDSPGFESTNKVLSYSGIMTVIEQLELNISHFNHNIIKLSAGLSPYREFLFGDDPENYDVVINVPKLKTHAMMGMTLGVKNTFGFIHAFEKAKWHLRAGQDRLLFASILIDIHNIVKPSLTILDGIIGMDGNGPSSGRPRNLGILGISKNAFILDECVEKLVHLSYPTPITHLAKKHGLLPQYETIDDDMPEIVDFMMPKTMDTDWNIPAFAKRFLKNTFIKKPKIDKKTCKGCAICVKVCPSHALSLKDGKPLFDYQHCIRCYCCQEMCPENAIKV